MLLKENSKDLWMFIDGKPIESTSNLWDGSHPPDCMYVLDEFTGDELLNETEFLILSDELPEYVLSKPREFAVTFES
jgi:hypothetical protein